MARGAWAGDGCRVQAGGGWPVVCGWVHGWRQRHESGGGSSEGWLVGCLPCQLSCLQVFLHHEPLEP